MENQNQDEDNLPQRMSLNLIKLKEQLYQEQEKAKYFQQQYLQAEKCKNLEKDEELQNKSKKIKLLRFLSGTTDEWNNTESNQTTRNSRLQNSKKIYENMSETQYKHHIQEGKEGEIKQQQQNQIDENNLNNQTFLSEKIINKEEQYEEQIKQLEKQISDLFEQVQEKGQIDEIIDVLKENLQVFTFENQKSNAEKAIEVLQELGKQQIQLFMNQEYILDVDFDQNEQNIQSNTAQNNNQQQMQQNKQEENDNNIFKNNKNLNWENQQNQCYLCKNGLEKEGLFRFTIDTQDFSKEQLEVEKTLNPQLYDKNYNYIHLSCACLAAQVSIRVKNNDHIRFSGFSQIKWDLFENICASCKLNKEKAYLIRCSAKSSWVSFWNNIKGNLELYKKQLITKESEERKLKQRQDSLQQQQQQKPQQKEQKNSQRVNKIKKNQEENQELMQEIQTQFGRSEYDPFSLPMDKKNQIDKQTDFGQKNKQGNQEYNVLELPESANYYTQKYNQKQNQNETQISLKLNQNQNQNKEKEQNFQNIQQNVHVLQNEKKNKEIDKNNYMDSGMSYEEYKEFQLKKKQLKKEKKNMKLFKEDFCISKEEELLLNSLAQSNQNNAILQEQILEQNKKNQNDSKNLQYLNKLKQERLQQLEKNKQVNPHIRNNKSQAQKSVRSQSSQTKKNYLKQIKADSIQLSYMNDLPLYPTKASSLEMRELLNRQWWYELHGIYFKKISKEDLNLVKLSVPIKNNNLEKLSLEEIENSVSKDQIDELSKKQEDEYYIRFCQTDFEQGDSIPMKNNQFIEIVKKPEECLKSQMENLYSQDMEVENKQNFSQEDIEFAYKYFGENLILYDNWKMDQFSMKEALRQQRYITKKAEQQQNKSNLNEIELEFLYLKKKLEKQIQETNHLKQKVIDKWKKDQGYDYEDIVESGKKETDVIVYNSILNHMKQGFQDKSVDILDYYYKGELQAQQTDFLEIDCKICFNQHTSELNPVVYCSKCDTSFHKFCYGIKELSDDDFYCDQCQEIRAQEAKGETMINKGQCAICEKSGLPIKKINNVWYHIVCLIITNSVIIREHEYIFRANINRATIHSLLDNQDICICEFCVSEKGYKLKCQHQGCHRCTHPYCGYLNGAILEFVTYQKSQQQKQLSDQNVNDFQQYRDQNQQNQMVGQGFQQLNQNESYNQNFKQDVIINSSNQEMLENEFHLAQLNYYCNNHIPDRLKKEDREKDQVIQVYLRRYAINHNQTVKLKDGFQTFEELYIQNKQKSQKNYNGLTFEKIVGSNVYNGNNELQEQLKKQKSATQNDPAKISKDNQLVENNNKIEKLEQEYDPLALDLNLDVNVKKENIMVKQQQEQQEYDPLKLSITNSPNISPQKQTPQKEVQQQQEKEKEIYDPLEIKPIVQSKTEINKQKNQILEYDPLDLGSQQQKEQQNSLNQKQEKIKKKLQKNDILGIQINQQKKKEKLEKKMSSKSQLIELKKREQKLNLGEKKQKKQENKEKIIKTDKIKNKQKNDKIQQKKMNLEMKKNKTKSQTLDPEYDILGIDNQEEKIQPIKKLKKNKEENQKLDQNLDEYDIFGVQPDLKNNVMNDKNKKTYTNKDNQQNKKTSLKQIDNEYDILAINVNEDQKQIQNNNNFNEQKKQNIQNDQKIEFEYDILGIQNDQQQINKNTQIQNQNNKDIDQEYDILGINDQQIQENVVNKQKTQNDQNQNQKNDQLIDQQNDFDSDLI
ncbi:Zinc finger, FYVE/PHD-type [Pseudocohnilembus persalinus]|uniref:Zinc finger, FYVE/PHD-type n=1 Tax=Pseudocohnilembus persalinus TaxID=266149 RepID=A0A0V0R1T6_PSEPJ|nr:Zinc finger, FYVE/PHD-type [Pseudocohnilembus persalinus]|eukprot:KRX08117.1 Zinc finger, FYVE/PHD-type [Pseudocohnilembus persalinus]